MFVEASAFLKRVLSLSQNEWVVNDHSWGEYFSLSCDAKDEDVFAWEVRRATVKSTARARRL